MLLSEDMQDGLEVDGLLVVNPFVAGNDGVIAGGAMRLLKPLLPLLAY
jgi:hypothetical protein